MSVRILQNKCVGCGKCLSVCPGNLLKKGGDGKIHIRNIRDCWGCTACLKECHTGAILYFLGADMGGMGSMLSVKEEGDVRVVIISFRLTFTCFSPNIKKTEYF